MEEIGYSIVKEFFEKRKAIWEGLVTFFKGKKTNFLFTGIAGTGKTVLYEHLSGIAFSKNYKPKGRSQYNEEGEIKVGGEKGRNLKKRRMGINVIPGQDSEPRITSLDKAFNSNELAVIVYVVSYGFATLRQSVSEFAFIEKGISTTKDFREEMLAAELKDFIEICGYIKRYIMTKKSSLKLVIAITKADLFYDDINKALVYYSDIEGNDSGFSKAIADLKKVVGANLDCETKEVACFLEEFRYNGEITSSKISENKRNELIMGFTNLLHEICKS